MTEDNLNPIQDIASETESLPVDSSPTENTTDAEKIMDATIQDRSLSSQFPNIAEFMEQNFKSFDVPSERYHELTNAKEINIREGELITGRIIGMSKDEIRVNINFKSYGVIPKSELVNTEAYSIGEEIDVYVDKIEDHHGRIILSRRRADFMRIWDDILAIHKSQEVVKVKILRRIKGGMVVDLLGIEAFLPGSQIDIRPIRDFDQ